MDNEIALNFLKTRIQEERKMVESLNFQFMAHPLYHELKQHEYAVAMLEEEIVKIEGVKIPEPPPVTTEEPAPPVESEESPNEDS